MGKRYRKADDKKILATVNIHGKKTDWKALEKVVSGNRTVAALKKRYYVLTHNKVSQDHQKPKKVSVKGAYGLFKKLLPHTKTPKQEEALVEVFKQIN